MGIDALEEEVGDAGGRLLISVRSGVAGMSGSLEQPYSPHTPRSIEDLTTPRPVLMPPPDVFDADLAEIESTIRPSVPDAIRKRIGVSRSLAVYGGFCYDFISVS